jgi:hypothetical protein
MIGKVYVSANHKRLHAKKMLLEETGRLNRTAEHTVTFGSINWCFSADGYWMEGEGWVD